MKDKIIGIVHEIIAYDSGYSCLFGNDDGDVLKHVSNNWIIPKSEDIKDSIAILLDNIVADVLSSYKLDTHDSLSLMNLMHLSKDWRAYMKDSMDAALNEAVYNPFLDKNYAIKKNLKFADLENYLKSMSIVENDHQIFIKLKFPIYEVPITDICELELKTPTN